MLEIAFYSNDPEFDYSKELAARLNRRVGEMCRVSSRSMLQTSLFEQLEAPPDLFFVDLRDDPDRGLDFIARLRRGAGAEVMVLAPGSQWAMRAYDLDVMSYFLEPADPDRIVELILRRFAQRLRTDELQFSFRTAGGTQMLPADRIVCVRYSDHRLILHTDRGQHLETTTMRSSFGSAAAPLLADPRFIRTHASYLVNVRHVSRFERYSLVMDTGETVPVSHARKPEVKRQLGGFFGRREND